MLKGYFKKPNNTPKPDSSLAASMLGTAQLFEELKNTKEDIENTSKEKITEINKKIGEVNSVTEENTKKIDNKIVEIEQKAVGMLQDIQNIPKLQGHPGKDADHEAIVKDVVSKMPTREELVNDTLSKIPKIDEAKLLDSFISKLPQNKASLKVIRETFVTDPMSVIDQIMKLPEDKFKLKTKHIEGLEQTISAFRNQLSRGYLHGGGFSNIYNAGTLVSSGLTGLNFAGTGVSSVVKDAVTGIITVTLSGGSSGLTVGTTAIASGTTTRILYDNAGVLGEYLISGNSGTVLMTNGSGASLTGIVTSVSGTTNRITVSPTTGAAIVDISASYVGQSSITTLGTITTGVWNGTAIANANLANSSITINGTSISLGGSGTITASATSMTVGTTTVLSGTDTRILYDNAGVLGEYTITGTGTVVAMKTSPVFVTPTLGVASATTVNKITITAPATGATLTIQEGFTLTVSGTANVSGTNSGDQTITLTGAVTGSGTGSFATTLATPGTLTVSTSNSNATAHTHAITSSSAPGAAASLLATDSSGILGSTGTRIVKIWATDLTVTNSIAGSITGNAATVTTNANLTGPITSVGNATTVANSINLPGSPTTTTQTPSDNSTKIATTAYVDAAILGQNFKEACLVATTANLVGAYVAGVFTYTATGVDTIDGVTLALGNRVLVKNQTTSFQNGIYTVTTAGAIGVAGILTRATDANTSGQFKTGDSVFITSGTANSTTTWAYTGVDSPTLGTDAITYAQIAGQGSFTQGNGITITGVSIAIDTSVTVDKTTAQTLTNKTLTSPIMTAPALGTPASGVMTNVTGVPAAAIVAGTFGAGSFSIGATTFTGDLTVSTKNIVTDTTTGTKFGTATNQKIGFYNATPIVQPTGDVITALQNLGLGASLTVLATTITSRTLWGQTYDGSGNVSGSLTAVANITGGASSMTITAGTGNSRTMALQSTTSGGTATTFLTGDASQNVTLAGNLTLGASTSTITGAAGNMTIVAGTGNSRTLILQSTTSGGTATTFLTGNADQTVTFASGFTAAGASSIGTGNAFTAGTIELGAASDTTISRVSAGVIAVEGVNVLLNGGALGTPSSGTLTNATGLPAASVVAGTLGSGTFTTTRLNYTNNAITASSNAATVPITSSLSTVTNSSAATLTVTMTTTSAVDGQMTIVRIIDFSAVAQTITWVNTEDSTVTAPTTSNGSTTLFLTVGFIYNGGTSKWRCIAKA